MDKIDIEKMESILNYVRMHDDAEVIYFLDIGRDVLGYHKSDKVHTRQRSIRKIMEEMREKGIDI